MIFLGEPHYRHILQCVMLLVIKCAIPTPNSSSSRRSLCNRGKKSAQACSSGFHNLSGFKMSCRLCKASLHQSLCAHLCTFIFTIYRNPSLMKSVHPALVSTELHIVPNVKFKHNNMSVTAINSNTFVALPNFATK